MGKNIFGRIYKASNRFYSRFRIDVISFRGGEGRGEEAIVFNFYCTRPYASWPSIFGYTRRKKMADRLGYTTGDCKRGLYVNIAWYIGYSLINTPFLFGKRFATPATSLPRAHSPSRPLLDTVLSSPRRRERRDRNLLFLNFCATPRVGTLPSLPFSLFLSLYENFSRNCSRE